MKHNQQYIVMKPCGQPWNTVPYRMMSTACRVAGRIPGSWVIQAHHNTPLYRGPAID